MTFDYIDKCLIIGEYHSNMFSVVVFEETSPQLNETGQNLPV